MKESWGAIWGFYRLLNRASAIIYIYEDSFTLLR